MAGIASYRLREIRIVGGFLDGVSFKFSDKLNCIIGARGTGKTSLLEFVRFALNAMPSDLNARRRIESLVANNLSGGRVDVTIETRDGLSYIISRTPDGDPMVLKPDGSISGMEFSPTLFRLDVFSQNEVENIAGQATSQLELLETFNQEELSRLNSEIDQTRDDLRTNAKMQLTLRKQIGELSDSIALLPGLTERLKEFTQINTEDAEILNRANEQKSIRDREKTYMGNLLEIYTETAKKIKGLKGGVGEQIFWYGADGLENGDNFDAMQNLLAELNACGTAIDEKLEEALNILRASWTRFTALKDTTTLKHQQAEVDFNKLVEKSNADKTRIAQRCALEKERNRLISQQNELNSALRRQEALQKERTKKLRTLSDCLDHRFALRKEIVNRINSALMPDIRVSIKQFDNHEAYQKMLSDGLKKCQIQHIQVARKIAELLSPERLSALVRAGNEHDLMEAAEINPNQAKAVISTLKNEAFLAELEIVDMPDFPKIELNDHDTYKTTETLSTGQKCNTILPILLLESDRPLLIDQPEDNLDNGYVHNIIVNSVLNVKQSRQLVFVTHNPNIPVLGDAEKMIVLASNGQVAHVQNSGTVDDCKEDIISLLEGGADAFRKRRERYDR